jgi:hypothetical protein
LVIPLAKLCKQWCWASILIMHVDLSCIRTQDALPFGPVNKERMPCGMKYSRSSEPDRNWQVISPHF